MSNIKINDVFQRIQYAATNGQTQFSIPFPFFQNNYVYVWQDGIQLDMGAAPGEYGITGAGSPSGGQITLVTPATLDSIITIEGVMPIDRTSIYSATISNLTGSDLNGDFNREVVMMKQIQTTQALLQLQYAPWALVSQDQSDTTDRYIPLLLPNQVWAMNPAGTEIIGYDVPESGGIAPNDAKYLLQQADSELPNAQAMGALASGLVINTSVTGVQLTRLMEAVANQLEVTNSDGIAGNPTYGFADNAMFPGTEGMGLIEGTTAQRPGTPVGTNFRFNTDLIILEYWDGSNWAQLSETDGVVVAIGTEDQVLVNDSFGVPVDGAITLTLSSTLNLPGTFNIQGSTAVDEIINDNTMATATVTNLATALSIKNYIDNTASGIVNPGLINELAYYAAAGSEVSGLTTANNGVLVTSAGGAPSISSTLPTTVQSNITQLGAQAAPLNMNTHLINNVVDPVSPQDAATKNYVDQTALTGTSVYVATTTNLGATQSGAGVGATLTDNSGTFAAFSLDGVSPPLNSNVLVKDYANAANEGIYTLTTNGDGVSVPWVLTRATSYNTVTEINNTGLIVIQNGSTLSGQAWYNTTTIVTVDTTAFNFSRFGTQGTVTSVATAGLATGGPINNTGTVTVTGADKATQETATSNTTAVMPSTQQYHPSSAKAWVLVEYSAGTPGLAASYNVSSLTDNGVGETSVNCTVEFSNELNSMFASIRQNSGSGGTNTGYLSCYSQAAFLGRINVSQRDTGGSAVDINFSAMAFGDQ